MVQQHQERLGSRSFFQEHNPSIDHMKQWPRETLGGMPRPSRSVAEDSRGGVDQVMAYVDDRTSYLSEADCLPGCRCSKSMYRQSSLPVEAEKHMMRGNTIMKPEGLGHVHRQLSDDSLMMGRSSAFGYRDGLMAYRRQENASQYGPHASFSYRCHADIQVFPDGRGGDHKPIVTPGAFPGKTVSSRRDFDYNRRNGGGEAPAAARHHASDLPRERHVSRQGSEQPDVNMVDRRNQNTSQPQVLYLQS